MNGASRQKNSVGPAWVNVAFGLWVIVSPFLLSFSRNSAAVWNNLAVGVALVLLALASGRGGGAIRGLSVPLGAWLFASPFVLGFRTAAFLWNNVIVAFAVIAGAAIAEGLRPMIFCGASSRRQIPTEAQS